MTEGHSIPLFPPPPVPAPSFSLTAPSSPHPQNPNLAQRGLMPDPAFSLPSPVSLPTPILLQPSPRHLPPSPPNPIQLLLNMGKLITNKLGPEYGMSEKEREKRQGERRRRDLRIGPITWGNTLTLLVLALALVFFDYRPPPLQTRLSTPSRRLSRAGLSTVRESKHCGAE